MRKGTKQSQGDLLVQKAKERKKKYKFIRTRMWVSFIASKLFMDRGTIPTNIGNNIFIGNNQIITKNSMTAIIQVLSLSVNTPINLIGEVIDHIKKYSKNVRIDVTIKTLPYKFDSMDSGLRSRKLRWKQVMGSERESIYSKERAARLLYSAEVLESGQRGYQTYMYFLLRSDDGRDLYNGIKECKLILSRYKVSHKEIKDNIELHLKHNLLISNEFSDKLKDSQTTLHTARTLVEILPTTQGMNDEKGILFGFDKLNNSPYFIDEKGSAGNKGTLIIGPAGWGKTVLMSNIAQDAHNAEGINLLITDLKGNEFTTLTKALKGTILSVSESSPYSINPFPLPTNNKTKLTNQELFNTSIALGKEYLRVVISASEKDAPIAEVMVNDFFYNLYMKLGVSENNINSWYRSKHLHPYIIAEEFELWMGVEQKARFGKLANHATDRVRIYLHKDSLNSGMWKYELDVDNIVDRSILTFDFGMLDEKRSYDETCFKLKFAQVEHIKDVYIARKKARGEWTLIVDEESSIAKNYVAEGYGKDFSLRRAQNCIPFVLCNSVTSLLEEPAFKKVLRNIAIKIIGNVTKTDRDFLIKEYDLENYEYVLKLLGKDSSYYRSFLLVNGFQSEAPTPILETPIPEKVAKGPLYTVVNIQE